jgi:hypothetical protein
MDLRVYEALFRFNQAMDQTLESLNIVEKLELVSPESVSTVRTNMSELRSYANNYFASKIAQREQEEASHFYRIRREREKAEADPNDIYRDVKARESLRREQGLPVRAVILPWTQADDDRILAMQKAASFLPTQPEQPRTISDSE